MSRVISRSAMTKVTPAQLEALVGQYRESLAEAAARYGRETNV